MLVVDDDESVCSALRRSLMTAGHAVTTTSRDSEAMAHADSGRFDVVLCDVNLDGARNGVDVLRAFKAGSPRTQVILMTGFGTVETAVEGVRAGAFDYLSKPFDMKGVLEVVARAGETARAVEPREMPLAPAAPPGLVGRTAPMLSVYKQIALAADAAAPVLIVGETGTGKELVARAIHSLGLRAKRRFEAVNCAIVAETLLASELFGHVKGAFTDAIADRQGLFETAGDGTVFLDEIGDTSPALQASLLRVLQDGDIRPVGSSRSLKSKARVVAATNRRLEVEVEEKRFREDLFYRLSAFTIRVPPLRERREDVPLLTSLFLRNACARAGRPVTLTDDAAGALLAHGWPGNVRELENTIERLVASTTSGRIVADDVAALLQADRTRAAIDRFADLPSLDELERRYLAHVLAAARGNRSRAAEILKIDRRTLYRMADRLGVPLPEDE